MSSVDAENLIKIAIHNFEKNEFKFFAKIPYIVYFRHIMTSTYDRIKYAYRTYVIGKITYISYIRSHLGFVYNLLVTNLSV